MAKGKKTGGRQRGSLNLSTREIKGFAQRFLSSQDYLKSAEKRVLDGKAPHLEVLWHHYGYGKPKETLQVDGQIPPFVVKLDASGE